MTVGSGLERLAAALSDRYRIERELGAGGMATVFLAEDLKHKRRVALKVLKPELAAVLGAERFVQEITTTASLQHPHILPLFDSGTADSFLYYVMPFIEGETLRDKLNRETQLGVEEAVRLTTEVADALDYAHRHGVIHRDIKPENILLHDGRPMVADFGIALAVSAAAGGRMTETGLSLGTPHYMSPEQATADKDITGRSDVYSLASVLYEMLTGNPPHVGSSAQQIIMKIIAETARPVTELRKSVPPNIGAALARALEKLPADRFDSARSFAEALANSAFAATGAMAGTALAAPGTKRLRLALAAVSAVALLATVTAIVFATRSTAGASREVTVSSLVPPDGEDFSERESFGAFSPDGRRFAFVSLSARGERRLWIRHLDSLYATPLAGTDGAAAPFWSPDGNSVAFFARGRLLRLELGEATPRPLCSTPTGESGTWGETGVIVIASDRGLERVRAEGGSCEVVIPIDSTRHPFHHPSLLPGDTRVVFERRHGLGVFRIMVGDLESGRSEFVVEGASPTFVPPGTLVYGRFSSEGNSVLYGQRLLPDGSGVEGDAVPLTGPVRTSGGRFAYSVSPAGTLAYLPGFGDRGKLVANRTGEVVDTVRQAGTWTHRYARGHPWAALASGGVVWLYDLTTGLSSRLAVRDSTARGMASYPAWAPADSVVVFGTCDLTLLRLEDLSTRTIQLGGGRCARVTDWSSDGRYLIVAMGDGDGTLASARSIGAYDLVDASYEPIDSSANTRDGALSPDMRWLAYVSDETGTTEVSVRPFRRAGRAIPVSRTGGRAPRWRGDGRELFFETPDGGIMSAPVSPGDAFQVSRPVMLFRAPGWSRHLFFDAGTPYDVSPDGKQFILRLTASGTTAVLVQNWIAKLPR